MKLRMMVLMVAVALMAAACSESQSSNPTSAALTASTAPGQANGHRGKLLDELDLTDAQREQVDAIFAAHKS